MHTVFSTVPHALRPRAATPGSGGASTSPSTVTATPSPPCTTAPPIPPDLLPPRLVDALLSDLCDLAVTIEEVRLRADRYATLTIGGRNISTSVILGEAELHAILTHMCGGSLYAYSDTIHQGFITLPGGVRVGIAGHAVCEGGRVIGVREVTGLCIRIPHRHGNVGGKVCHLLRRMAAAGGAPQGVLIYAPPGVGKTTLLRGVAAGMAGGSTPWRTVVIDTRGELGFAVDAQGLCLDVLEGYPRARGIEIATRTLSAQLIICDEIGDVEEAMALISSHHGGVPLVASAHAGTVDELMRRTGIRLLHEARLFGAYIGLSRSTFTDPTDENDGFTYRITPWADAERIAQGGTP